MKSSNSLIGLLLIVNIALVAFVYWTNVASKSNQIPDLIGTWKGENVTVSELKGYKVWGEKVVTITEQKDRRFKGTFTYPDGTKNFFGVIYPDNESFTWVASNSRGYNHGKIMGNKQIAACYVESWEQATAGCATLNRISE
jgi:hypothetical protein